jgi:hypothetical protein
MTHGFHSIVQSNLTDGRHQSIPDGSKTALLGECFQIINSLAQRGGQVDRGSAIIATQQILESRDYRPQDFDQFTPPFNRGKVQKLGDLLDWAAPEQSKEIFANGVGTCFAVIEGTFR